jgi:hypothetical protein
METTTMRKLKNLPASLAALAACAAFALAAHAQDGKGDNRDDHRSGKTDRKGDGNSGHGDDLHRKHPPHGKGDRGDCPCPSKDRERPEGKERPPRDGGGDCPFHAKDRERPPEKKDRPARPEGKERGERPPRPEPDPEHKKCMEAFRRAMAELREAHNNGDLTCDEVRERIARLKERLKKHCKCGHHGDKERPRGEGKPPHRDH